MKNRIESSVKLMVMISVACFSLGASQSFAQEGAGGVGLVLYSGITFGGEELVEVEAEFGADGELEAGGFILLGGGLKYSMERFPIDLQATLGVHFDVEFADNGDASFTRFPADVIAFYRAEKHRVGLGFTYHLNPKLDFDIDGVVDDAESLGNELGFVVEYNYLSAESVAVGVRYVDIDYFLPFFGDLDGSYVGIVVNYFL